jgi:carboxypeptidase Taq
MTAIADLRYASAMLQWDQETYMPPNGAARRGQQIATLDEQAHAQFTSDETKRLLETLLTDNSLSASQQKNVELCWYDFNKAHKLSAAFVGKLSLCINKSFHAWVAAKNADDFALFEKDLQALIELKQEEAQLKGYVAHPYNALLNDYERGSTVAQLDQLFGGLEPKLKALLQTVQIQQQPSTQFLQQHFPKAAQMSWGNALVEALHYDTQSGRQDISEHPFTINFNAKDVRITTRIDEADFSNMTWSCIHELGHALYEQGLPDEEYGLPLGEAASLSMHESQSRLWENCVGRSLEFWQHYLPMLRQHFPEQFKQVEPLDFYRAINIVQPSLIRTEADELTYHFHVMIRYELEKELISGSLKAKDLPAAWNAAYQQKLGIAVPNHRKGCLQDVHWSHGSFGYFPTYSLGSMYAAQIFQAASKAIGDLPQKIAAGQTQPLLDWLRLNIHRHGRQYGSEELCILATGQPLNPDSFIAYLTDKLTKVYN